MGISRDSSSVLGWALGKEDFLEEETSMSGVWKMTREGKGTGVPSLGNHVPRPTGCGEGRRRKNQISSTRLSARQQDDGVGRTRPGDCKPRRKHDFVVKSWRAVSPGACGGTCVSQHRSYSEGGAGGWMGGESGGLEGAHESRSETVAVG